jgi:hypothetical protein
MQKKVRYFQLGLVSLLIITFLVIFPAAATISSDNQGSAFTRFTSYKLSDPSRAAGLMGHAVLGYYANPARFTSINSTTFSVPTSTFNAPDGSSTPGFSIPDLFPSSDYSSISQNWDDLFSSPTPSGGSCGG